MDNVITLAEISPNPLGVTPVTVLTTAREDVVIWPCPRCYDEDGRIAMYAHVAGGVCFKCQGAGGQEMDRAVAEKRAARLLKSRVKAAEKREADRLEALARREQWQQDAIAERPLLAVLLTDEAGTPGGWYDDNGVYQEGSTPLGSFVAKMADRFRFLTWQGKFSAMTEKQLDAAVRAIETERAKIEAKKSIVAPAPGKATFEGVVIKSAWYDDNFGGGGIKITVKTEAGWLAFGTLPRRMWRDDNTETGQRVQIEATLEASDRDPAFLFFKRPTKGTRWL